MVWAWDRPEDLTYIDTSRVGVAYLAGTVIVEPDRISAMARHGRVRLAPGTRTVVTVRVQDRNRGRLQEDRVETAAAEVMAFFDAAPANELQIDFDALVSERPAYRRLIRILRQRLPESVRLSVTGLASWCLGDPWIRDLGVDVVPQLYRMAGDDRRIRLALERGGGPSSPACLAGVGLMLDEPFPEHWPVPTRWYFSPKAWTPALAARVGLLP